MFDGFIMLQTERLPKPFKNLVVGEIKSNLKSVKFIQLINSSFKIF